MRPLSPSLAILTVLTAGCTTLAGLDKNATDDTDVDTDTVDTVDTDTVDTVHTDTVDTTDTDTVDTTDTDPVVDTSVPWSHTIAVDGDLSDWVPGERFATSAGAGTDAWLTWDASNLYVGLHHGDVASGGALHWLVITVGDGGPGAGVGTILGTQQPALPFPATHVVRWKLDDSYGDLRTWDGTQWVGTDGWLGTQGSAVAESNANAAVELRLPFTALGITDTALVHVNLVYEGEGFETSYAAAPSTSFADGSYDPDYGAFFELTPGSFGAPNTAAVRTSWTPVDTDTDSDAPDTDDSDSDDTDVVDTDTDTDLVDTDTDTDPPPWSHTVTIDGDAGEWTAAERTDTTSGAGTSTWFTWDADNVYVAVQHPDVASGGAQTWLLVTMAPAGVGDRVGSGVGTQEPQVPFPVTHVVRWKADDSYDDLLTWNGTDYDVDDYWLNTQGSAKAESNANQVVELRLPRAVLGLVDTWQVHVNWVYEGAGFESSYGVSPTASFAEGAYDPDYGAWWAFDLDGHASPSAYAPRLPTGDTDTDTGGADSDTDVADTDTDVLDSDTDDTDAPDSDTDETDVLDTDGTDVPDTDVLDTDTDTDSDTDTDVIDTDTDVVDTDTDVVDTDTDVVDTDTDVADTDTDTDTDVPWSYPLTVDGSDADWLAAIAFPTSSGAPTETVVTWDDDTVYVGVRHPDVAAGGGQHWLVVTLGDGVPGGLVGSALGTQLPGLPFVASHLVQWKADDSYDALQTWDGFGWQRTDMWLGTQGSAKAESNANTVVELALPRGVLGLVDHLDLHVAWVFEGAGNESSYGATPDTSFVEGSYDPDYGAWLSFDLTDGAPPADAPVITAPTQPWAHTITVDGSDADWLAGERFATSAGGTTATLLTWDADTLYVGAHNPDVASGGAQHWLVVTLGDGMHGGYVGSAIAGQEPALVSPATHVVRWKADDSYDDLLTWNGTDYDVDDYWLGTQGSAKAESNANAVVELALPFAALGITGDLVTVDVTWVYEGAGFESSYACTPAGMFPDGTFDPDHGSWYAFDRRSPLPPNVTPVQP
ncbi:MAG: hypothetical protein H6733_16635 [Alphaproteobacteria bacterium]|nr:hypothetical protein [Alphaproteobacteria bacterium]